MSRPSAPLGGSKLCMHELGEFSIIFDLGRNAPQICMLAHSCLLSRLSSGKRTCMDRCRDSNRSLCGYWWTSAANTRLAKCTGYMNRISLIPFMVRNKDPLVESTAGIGIDMLLAKRAMSRLRCVHKCVSMGHKVLLIHVSGILQGRSGDWCLRISGSEPVAEFQFIHQIAVKVDDSSSQSTDGGLFYLLVYYSP